jgi:hypothetical protein
VQHRHSDTIARVSQFVQKAVLFTISRLPKPTPKRRQPTHKAAIPAKGPAVGLLMRSLLSARLCDNLKDFYTLWPKGLSRFRGTLCRKNTPFFS